MIVDIVKWGSKVWLDSIICVKDLIFHLIIRFKKK